MTDILLCRGHVRHEDIQQMLGVPVAHLTGMDNKVPGMIMPYHPYLIGENPSSLDKSIQTILGTGSNLRMLTDLTNTYGSNNVLAFATLHKKLKNKRIITRAVMRPLPKKASDPWWKTAKSGVEPMTMSMATAKHAFEHFGHTPVAASADGLENSITHFITAVGKYLSARASGDGRLVTAVRRELKIVFKQMKAQFEVQIKLIKTRIPVDWDDIGKEAGRLTSRGGKLITKLHLSDLKDARILEDLSSVFDFIAKKMVFINIFLDSWDVWESYEHGGHWGRAAASDGLKIFFGYLLGIGLDLAIGAAVAAAAEAAGDVIVILTAAVAIAALFYLGIETFDAIDAGIDKLVRYMSKAF